MKILAVVLALLLTGPVFGEETRNPQELLQELEVLEAEIQKFRDKLKKNEGERSELESSLKA
ncbi:MAG: putative nuclease with TOPRIM domain, partial [Candidatus Azotimanducaceae bacterium]